MKSKFVLELYVRLKNGETLAPESVTNEFGVCERTFYRYVADLKSFFEERTVWRKKRFVRRNFCVLYVSPRLSYVYFLKYICAFLPQNAKMREGEDFQAQKN